MGDKPFGWLYFCLDAVCFIAVGLAALLLIALKPEPSHRGFFCDDESIKKPMRPETVPTNTALAIGVCIVIGAIIIGEIAREFLFRCKPRGPCRNGRSISCGLITVKPWQQRILYIIIMFIFGCIVTYLFTDIGKLVIGRPRPYFLSVCKPDPAKTNCTTGKYIDYEVCTGNKKDIHEARLSFPSGHSSFSAYTMVFLAIYLEAAIPTKKTVLFKPFLQVAAIVLGVLCALSRIFDNRHHWGDVLTGLVIGTIVAVFIVFKPLQLFSRGSCTCCEEHVIKNVSIGHEMDVESQTSPNVLSKL